MSVSALNGAKSKRSRYFPGEQGTGRERGGAVSLRVSYSLMVNNEALAARQGEMDISVVIPVYNEEGALPELYRVLADTLDQLPQTAEIIFANDGSRDGSDAITPPPHDRDAPLLYPSFPPTGDA